MTYQSDVVKEETVTQLKDLLRDHLYTKEIKEYRINFKPNRTRGHNAFIVFRKKGVKYLKNLKDKKFNQ